MVNKQILRLMKGYRQFHEKFYSGEDATYARLSNNGQVPKNMIIGCSDSRVDPAILSSANPGELFVVRNVANLVPPFEQGGGLHGVSAAIEFATVNLKVENIFILGHRQCGGIRALLFPEEIQNTDPSTGFLKQWVRVAEPAKIRAMAQAGHEDQPALWRCCELESIRTSMENLRSFPFVRTAVESRGLNLIGLYFDLEKGEMLELDEATGGFTPVVF